MYKNKGKYVYTLLWSFDIVSLLIQILGIHSVGEPRQVLHRLIREMGKQMSPGTHHLDSGTFSNKKKRRSDDNTNIKNIPFFVLTGQTAAGASAGWGTFLISVGVDGLFPILSVMMTLAIYKSVEKAS
jgi:hypothetical protein